MAIVILNEDPADVLVFIYENNLNKMARFTFLLGNLVQAGPG
jgi:hypothetical protein